MLNEINRTTRECYQLLLRAGLGDYLAGQTHGTAVLLSGRVTRTTTLDATRQTCESTRISPSCMTPLRWNRGGHKNERR